MFYCWRNGLLPLYRIPMISLFAAGSGVGAVCQNTAAPSAVYFRLLLLPWSSPYFSALLVQSVELW